MNKVVMATIALHNYLRSKAEGRYILPDSIDRVDCNGVVNEGSSRREVSGGKVKSVPNSQKGRQSQRAEGMRDKLCLYFNGPGQIPWQWNVILR